MACVHGFDVLAAQDDGPVGGENKRKQRKSLNRCARRHRREVYRQIMRLRPPCAAGSTVMQVASVPGDNIQIHSWVHQCPQSHNLPVNFEAAPSSAALQRLPLFALRFHRPPDRHLSPPRHQIHAHTPSINLSSLHQCMRSGALRLWQHCITCAGCATCRPGFTRANPIPLQWRSQHQGNHRISRNPERQT